MKSKSIVWVVALLTFLIFILLMFPTFLNSDASIVSAEVNDGIPELFIDGPEAVKAGTPFAQTIKIDGDVPETPPVGEDLIGGLLFTIIIPQVCSDGTLFVSIDPAWNATASTNVQSSSPDHVITILASAIENLDSSEGLDVAKIQCIAQSIDNGPVIQTFQDIQASKFDPNFSGSPVMVEVFGSDDGILVVRPGDADLDGDVDIIDIIKMLRHIIRADLMSSPQIVAADVSPVSTLVESCGDGKLDIFDVVAVIRAMLSDDSNSFLLNRCTP